MVTTTIKELKDKKGSSLQGIKKFMAANYKVDSTKVAPFIHKFLKATAAKGLFMQNNGSDASGHFKMAVKIKKSVPKKRSLPRSQLPKCACCSSQKEEIAGEKV
jgi:histone H1/5